MYQRVREGKKDVWLAVSSKPFFEENGQFIGYRGAGTDITGRVEAEEAMQKRCTATLSTC